MIGRPRRDRPPLWFELALVALVGAALQVCDLDAGAPPPVAGAWFVWLVAVAHGIWTGVQVAGRVTLLLLQWSVQSLWYVARAIGAGLGAFGRQFLASGKVIWRFVRATYEHVLRPMWVKFWGFIEWARAALERVFGPVFRMLRTLRTELLKIYEKFVRPVLDTIDLTRRVLRVFSSLGADWARALDTELARLQAQIDAPFRALLGKLNEVINLVNRIVTADGLFQRLALIRSIERDIRYVSNAWWNAFHRPATASELAAARARSDERTIAEHREEWRAAMRENTGPLAARIREEIADFRLILRRS